jgi:sec-independent protein translocase protein TatC
MSQDTQDLVKQPQKKQDGGRKQHERTPDGDIRMTFTEHLGELRNRIMYAGAAMVVAFIICYAFSEQMYETVSRPLQPKPVIERVLDPVTGEEIEKVLEPEIIWVQLTVIEWFLVKLKLAAYGGLLIASPVIIYQLCAFVFPGLRPHERRVIRVMLGGGVGLGIVGVSIAYFLVFPIVLRYLVQLAPEGIETTLRMSDNVSILIKGYLAFAIAFQFPMVVLVLVYMDLLSPASLREHRKYAVVGIAVMSAIFTPPEPFSMMIMMIPLYGLYEISIWMSYLVVRRNKQKAADA